MPDDPLPRLPPVDPASASVPPDSLTPELLASLLVEGDDELAAWALQHALAGARRADVYDGLLARAMELVGDRWASGQWGVSEEHRASRTILRALERVRPDLGPEGRIGPLAVLAAVAGERHMIGLVCLAQVLQEEGWTVAELGADVPPEDLGRFVGSNEPRLVALTCSAPERLDATIAAIQAVRAARPGLPILLGGRLASQPEISRTLGIEWAGTSLVEAERVARARMGAVAAD